MNAPQKIAKSGTMVVRWLYSQCLIVNLRVPRSGPTPFVLFPHYSNSRGTRIRMIFHLQ